MKRVISQWGLPLLVGITAVGVQVAFFAIWPSLKKSTAANFLVWAGITVVAVVIYFGVRAWSASRGSEAKDSAHSEPTGRDKAGSSKAPERTLLHESLLAEGNTIDTRYRYQRLLYSPIRSSQVAVVASTAAAPVTLGGLLVWTLFEPSARQAVGIYLIVASLAGATVWLVTSPLYRGWFAEQRGEKLRIRVLGNLATSQKASTAEPTTRRQRTKLCSRRSQAEDNFVNVGISLS